MFDRFKNIHYIHFDHLDSTQTWAKENGSTFDPDVLTCIFAENQTKGYGRHKQSWLSSQGNLAVTLHFSLLKKDLSHMLAQILSYSCASILKKEGFSPQIKWPNDLYLCEKKIGGVLGEVHEIDGKSFMVLGLGLNVNMSENELSQIDQSATSLFQISEKEWSPFSLLISIIEEFRKDLHVFETAGFTAFKKDYEDLLIWKDEEIVCKKGEQDLEGKILGIADNGGLILLKRTGEKEILYSGNIRTLRKAALVST